MTRKFEEGKKAVNEKHLFTRKRVAFTLAEVLITLAVIGIVAAMTIPTLINNYEKKAAVTKLKLAYSQLYNAIKLSEIDNGPVSTWDMPLGEDETSSEKNGKEFFEKYLKNYLKISKECSYEECGPKKAVYLDGNNVPYVKRGYYFVLNNGTTVKIWTRQGYLTEVNVFVSNKDASVTGKDRFSFVIIKKASENVFGKFTSAGFYPYGYGYDREYLRTQNYSCAKKGSLAGVYCAALIMLDGWEIKDDYPW